MWWKQGHTPLQLKTLLRAVSYHGIGSRGVKELIEAVLNNKMLLSSAIIVHFGTIDCDNGRCTDGAKSTHLTTEAFLEGNACDC